MTATTTTMAITTMTNKDNDGGGDNSLRAPLSALTWLCWRCRTSLCCGWPCRRKSQTPDKENQWRHTKQRTLHSYLNVILHLNWPQTAFRRFCWTVSHQACSVAERHLKSGHRTKTIQLIRSSDTQKNTSLVLLDQTVLPMISRVPFLIGMHRMVLVQNPEVSSTWEKNPQQDQSQKTRGPI